MDILGGFSRRNMLIGLGGAAAISAVSARAVAAVVQPPATLATAALAEWRTKLGTNFTASSGQILRLVQVEAVANRGTRPAGLRPQGFLALFDVVRGAALAEGLYRVAHPTGGTFEIFLAKGPSNLPLRMVASFN